MTLCPVVRGDVERVPFCRVSRRRSSTHWTDGLDRHYARNLECRPAKHLRISAQSGSSMRYGRLVMKQSM